MDLLIDTNILLDWTMQREPFAEEAEKIIGLCIDEEVRGYVACHSLLNAFYVMRKGYSIEERREAILMFCETFTIVGIDEDMLLKSLGAADFHDIEDGLQVQCAVSASVDYIITRDPKGFKNSEIPVLSPEAFLARMEMGE